MAAHIGKKKWFHLHRLVHRLEFDAYHTNLQRLLGRIEFDAYRTDVESLQLGPRDAATTPKIEEAQRKYANHKEKYDKLRADVAIKLKFLEENKVSLMWIVVMLCLVYCFTGTVQRGSHVLWRIWNNERPFSS